VLLVVPLEKLALKEPPVPLAHLVPLDSGSRVLLVLAFKEALARMGPRVLKELPVLEPLEPALLAFREPPVLMDP